jgi:photosystem II stability/assembly factor-like uncharacterized protein
MSRFSVTNGLASIFLGAVLFGSASAQIPSSWKSVGVGGGGALFAPTFNPSNPKEMWLSCDMTGLYHTLNQGQSWTLVPFGTIQAGPYAPQLQYASNKTTVYSVDTTGGNLTPVVSKNSGTTWAPLANDPTEQGAFYLAADPTTTTRLFVTDYADLYFSKDAGKTWSTIVTGDNDSGVVLAGTWFDGNNIYAATSLGIYVSKNGGSSFSKLATPGIPSTEQIVTFAAAKSGTTTRFAAVTLGPGQIYGGIGGDNYNAYAGLYTFDMGTSTSWTSRTSAIPSGNYPFYVGMALNDINNLYVAGSDDDGNPVIFKSINGGKNWSSVLNTSSTQNVITGYEGFGGDVPWGYDGLVSGFTVDPTNSENVAFSGYGFCHISTNGAKSWQQVYASQASQHPAGAPTPKGKNYIGVGLENTSSWWLTWSDSANMWASFTDIQGIKSGDAGNSWNFNYTGMTLNTSYQVVKGPTGILYMATSSNHDMYESTHLTDSSIDSGIGNVLTSSNKGATWTRLGSIGHIVMGVALDPTNSKRMYCTVANSKVGGVYVCSDITKGTSATWTRLAAPPRTQGHAFNIQVLNDGTLVATYSGRMAPSFTDSSGVFVSTDGGKTWLDRSSSNMHWWTLDLTVAPSNSKQETWYVGVYSGWGGTANNRGGLYKTTNRGLTWTRIWQSDRVGGCAIDPKNPNMMYATTETEGLWASLDATAANPSFSLVKSYPFSHPERVFFNPYKPGEVWVTSFGNGLRVGEQTSP